MFCVERAFDLTMTTRTELEKKILRAATELFATGGFAVVGIRAIAREAHTSIGTIYHYFEGKRDILEVVLRKEIEVRKQLLEDLRSQGLPFEEQVQQLLLTHFALLREAPNAAKVYSQERLYAGSLLRRTLRNLHEEVVKYVADLLTEGMNTGTIVPCNATIAAYAVLGLVEALSYRILEGDETAAVIMEKGPEEVAKLLSSWLGKTPERKKNS